MAKQTPMARVHMYSDTPEDVLSKLREEGYVLKDASYTGNPGQQYFEVSATTPTPEYCQGWASREAR